MFSKPIIETENYYSSFLKKIKEEKENVEKNTPTLFFSYVDFFSKKINLNKYKLPELKDLAKNHKLLISGNKSEVINRISHHFNANKMCERIQRIFRGHLVRYKNRLRGNNYPNYSKYVNDTDFYSLETISEIPDERIFSFQDEKGFQYWFDILSLVSIIKSVHPKGQITNPYNREKFSNTVLKQIVSFYSILLILYPEKYVMQDIFSPLKDIIPIAYSQRQERRNIITRQPTSLQPGSLTERIRQWDLREQQSRNIIRQIREEKTINYRIIQLFHEIDTLGNYSSPHWFSELTIESYKSLYETCYQWWRRTNNMSIQVKNAICGIHDPFSQIDIIRTTESREESQEIVLNLFEILIFTGIDTEHRTLGALHVLGILTTVSTDARRELPWLFEAIV